MIESGDSHSVDLEPSDAVRRSRTTVRRKSSRTSWLSTLETTPRSTRSRPVSRAWSTGNSAFQLSGESTGGAVYMAVWRHLLANTFHDDLPEDYWPTGGSRWFVVMNDLLANEPEDPFWDDTATVEVEIERSTSCSQSMVDAHRELTDLLGDDTGKWTWGQVAHCRVREPDARALRDRPRSNGCSTDRHPTVSVVARRSSTPSAGTPTRATTSTGCPHSESSIDLSDWSRTRRSSTRQGSPATRSTRTTSR